MSMTIVSIVTVDIGKLQQAKCSVTSIKLHAGNTLGRQVAAYDEVHLCNGFTSHGFTSGLNELIYSVKT
ncbi:hypothetical protein LSAT2_030602 [Lamellibrachia satsuma]|nr:hypothetical protein LSAT2_030602 [Lamellibrachia satsuma]